MIQWHWNEAILSKRKLWQRRMSLSLPAAWKSDMSWGPTLRRRLDKVSEPTGTSLADFNTCYNVWPKLQYLKW
jgi:hypothetical protein